MAIERQSRTSGRFASQSSTCISNITYNPESEDMDVTFHNPTIGKWRYFNVDTFTAAGFIESASRGEYFNNYIRGVYEYGRVE